jgi:hypothetical protein
MIILKEHEETTKGNNDELANPHKSRNRRRLRARWSCGEADHRYCFANLNGVHVPLSDEDMEVWVSAMVWSRPYFLLRSVDAYL